jgi:NAD(P)-dependent dehydrogenase (short-subunit alcohol dehydrogenase family)
MTALTEHRQHRIPRSLDQKVVLVTGGAKNLGGLIGRDVAAHGARVAVHYHGSDAGSAADATVAAAIDAGAEAFAFQADLSDPSEVRRLFNETVGRFGSLYATVNTAGVVNGKPLVDISEAEYDASMGINAKAAFFARPRLSTSRARSPRSSWTDRSRSTRSHPGRWTHRSSGTPRIPARRSS